MIAFLKEKLQAVEEKQMPLGVAVGRICSEVLLLGKAVRGFSRGR